MKMNMEGEMKENEDFLQEHIQRTKKFYEETAEEINKLLKRRDELLSLGDPRYTKEEVKMALADLEVALRSCYQHQKIAEELITLEKK